MSANTGLDAIKRAPIVDYDTGIKCLRIQDVSQSKAFSNWGFTDVEERNYKKFQLKENDIFIARTGASIGVNRFISEDAQAVFNNGLIRIRVDTKKCFPKYLFYNFRTTDYQGFIESISGGTSTQPNMQIGALLSFEIYLPGLEEQKAIASVLSSLDDKIDLLHRQNTTLERMAETLFRQWFVEEAQEDWDEVTIADLIEFNPLRKLSKNQISTYLDMAGLDTSNFNPTGWYQRAFSSGTKFINNDTLLARITPCLENGKTGYVSFLSENEVGWGSTEFIVMRPKLGIHPIFAYVLARYQDFRDYAEGCMEGSSGRQRVNTDHLKQYQIRIPSKEVIQRFNEAVSAITPKLELNAKQIQTLEKLRDNLLPKLMCGEVRVVLQAESALYA